jgi:hypothetical protein
VKEPFRSRGMIQIEAVAIELLDGRRGDHDACGVGEFEDVEGEQEGIAEGRDEAIVWWGVECKEIGSWRWRCAHEGAIVAGGDGEREEGLVGHFGLAGLEAGLKRGIEEMDIEVSNIENSRF